MYLVHLRKRLELSSPKTASYGGDDQEVCGGATIQDLFGHPCGARDEEVSGETPICLSNCDPALRGLTFLGFQQGCTTMPFLYTLDNIILRRVDLVSKGTVRPRLYICTTGIQC